MSRDRDTDKPEREAFPGLTSRQVPLAVPSSSLVIYLLIYLSSNHLLNGSSMAASTGQAEVCSLNPTDEAPPLGLSTYGMAGVCSARDPG